MGAFISKCGAKQVCAIRRGLLALAVFSLFAASGPAEARESVAQPAEIAAADCARQVYTGLASRSSTERCGELFFVPTSAALKCGLYRDAGYPSSLMRKACQLFDQGAVEFFLEDKAAEK